jgi:hypothetical protein
MKKIKWFVFGLLVALVVADGCAPTDDPIPAATTTEEGESGSAGDAVAAKEEKQPAQDKQPEKVLASVPATLRSRIEAAVRNVRQRRLYSTNAFWTVFHGILGLGPGVKLTDKQSGEQTAALDYISSGGELRGLRFKPTLVGVEVITTGDGVGQGHQDQFIAEMAQWSMPAKRRMVVGGKDFTFMDFVRQSQVRARVNANQELSWTILIVAQYFGTNVSWTNLFNEKLHFDDVLRYELAAPIETAACGGTHRLFGLSWAYHLYLQKGGQIAGLWSGVPEKTARYRDLARRFQNSDGSFSTSYFRSRGNAPDKNLRIGSTGHILEWLALALSDEELREQWVQDAASALALLILDLQGSPIDSGSMYHAVHGLQIYHARVFGGNFCPSELAIPLPPGWKKP